MVIHMVLYECLQEAEQSSQSVPSGLVECTHTLAWNVDNMLQPIRGQDSVSVVFVL